MDSLRKTKILGTNITTDKKENILEYLVKNAGKKPTPLVIVTPNPEIIMYARKHPEFQEVINKADVALPDGVGVVLAAQILKHERISRTPGVEFMQELVKVFAAQKTTVKNQKLKASRVAKSIDGIGLFGGQEGVAEITAECLQKKYSGIKVLYADHEWNKAKLKDKRLAVLFVALGHPKQEKWISENINTIPADIVMAVGGSFDFLSGRVRRSPVWVQKIGLEWLFRLLIQPWRWRRQLALVSFVREVLKEAVMPQNEHAKTQ